MREVWECTFHRKERGIWELPSTAGAPAFLERHGGAGAVHWGPCVGVLHFSEDTSASLCCTANMCVPVPWKRNGALRSVN